MEAWKALGEIPTAWLPARVRARDQEHAKWDNYATQEDILAFMTPFRVPFGTVITRCILSSLVLLAGNGQ